MSTILIKNSIVVPMTPLEEGQEPYFLGEVMIKDDRIEGIGSPGTFKTADRVFDAQKQMLLPGLVNTHNHAAMVLFRGYADDLPLMDWLEKKIWPLEAKLKPKDIYAGTLLSIAEMLLSGTTTFNDMYFHMEDVAKAVEETGIRAVLGYGIIGNNIAAKASLKKAAKFAEKYQGSAQGRITTTLGPHAPYTCPPDFMKEVIAEAKRLGCPIHIHLAETEGEVEGCLKEYGLRTVELMKEIGLFEVPVLAAHCVYVSEKEQEILAENKVGVAHNPESNLKLASGIAPIPKMLQKGIQVGLGTDGAASNNDLDLFGEMRTAALIHKGYNLDPTVMPAFEVLSMATRLGAEALGLGKEIGTIEIEKKADLILVDLKEAYHFPHHNILANLVYSAKANDVTTVIVDGQILVENRRFMKFDLEEIEKEVEERAEKLIS